MILGVGGYLLCIASREWFRRPHLHGVLAFRWPRGTSRVPSVYLTLSPGRPGQATATSKSPQHVPRYCTVDRLHCTYHFTVTSRFSQRPSFFLASYLPFPWLKEPPKTRTSNLAYLFRQKNYSRIADRSSHRRPSCRVIATMTSWYGCLPPLILPYPQTHQYRHRGPRCLVARLPSPLHASVSSAALPSCNHRPATITELPLPPSL